MPQVLQIIMDTKETKRTSDEWSVQHLRKEKMFDIHLPTFLKPFFEWIPVLETRQSMLLTLDERILHWKSILHQIDHQLRHILHVPHVQLVVQSPNEWGVHFQKYEQKQYTKDDIKTCNPPKFKLKHQNWDFPSLGSLFASPTRIRHKRPGAAFQSSCHDRRLYLRKAAKMGGEICWTRWCSNIPCV